MNALAFFSGLGPAECVALVVIGILLYGKNLPTVARTVGRAIGEFKRQMKSVEDQVKREAFHEDLKKMREDEEKRAKEKQEREEREAKEREEREKKERDEREKKDAAPQVEAPLPPAAGPAGPPVPASPPQPMP